MHLEGDDILEASLLKAADNEPGASLTPAEVALLGKDPTSQEAWKTITCPPDQLEETSKAEGRARLADPQDAQEPIPLLPLGFGPQTPVSSPPPPEDAGPLVSIPGEAQTGYNLSGLCGNDYSQEYPNG